MSTERTDCTVNDHTGADGVFTTATFPVKLKTNTKPLTIIPIGDIHHDAPGHCNDAWQATLARIKQLDKDKMPYALLGMGDYVDFASTTERARLARQGELHESTHASFDRQADSNLLKLQKQLWFTRGKWIGWIQGNHYWRYLTGSNTGKTTSMMLAESLGGKWLGWCTYVRIGITSSDGGKTRVDIFASHGKGGGQLIGSAYNNVHKMRNVFPAADIYLMGHDHSRGAISKTILECRVSQMCEGDLIPVEKRQISGRTGSYLKAYDTGNPNYVVKALMSPADLGHIEIIAKVTRTCRCQGQKKAMRVDLSCVS